MKRTTEKDPYLGTTISFRSPWGTPISGELLYVADNEVAVVREVYCVELHIVDVWGDSLGSYGASAIEKAKLAADAGRIIP
jgi:hypothetical protein